jgi:SAM-dependent methyltransferase
VDDPQQTTRQIQESYDAIAYECRAYRHTHPDAMAVEGCLRGLTPPAVESCRVLEIGCSTGANLIPMAEALPASTFRGIDLSAQQIDAGNQVIQQLKLPNIKLCAQDLTLFPPDSGEFDFIIAHGVYSWVPASVREALFEICRRHLAPRGLAYISFNAYPGARHWDVAREMMLFHARSVSEPIQRAANGRQIIRFVAEQTPDTRTFRDDMRNIVQEISGLSDRQLLHDQMSPELEGKYVWQFIEQARSHELDYVGDVGPYQNPWFEISPPVREFVFKLSLDRIAREQYLDFLVNRSFRCAVLSRAAATPAQQSPAARRIGALHAAGRPAESFAGTNAQKLPVFEFASGKTRVLVSNPRSVALLRRLRDTWPAAIAFADLQRWWLEQLQAPAASAAQHTEDLAKLVELYGQMKLIELWPRSTRSIAAIPPPRPRASRCARWQAERDNVATSLRHENITLDSAFRQLLPLLDGSRDRAALAQELIRLKQDQPGGNWPAKNPQHLEQMLDATLKLMTASSLILAEQ